MAFLSIESTNPKFSYIIQKNPANPAPKEIRQGVSLGWFATNQKYCVVFKDPPQEMSYSNAEFDYLDITAFSSPTCYSNLLRDYFSGLLKKESELDSPLESCKITLGFIKCDKRNLEHFAKFFDEVFYVEQANNIYKVEFNSISYQGSIRKLLHLANLFCIFMMAADDDYYLDVNEGIVEKYLNSLSVIQVPYYIANLFKVQFLRTRALFSKYLSQLKTACIEDVNFEFGNTLQARKAWVESSLKLNNNIIDIGAGVDFSYSFLSRNINGIYYPVDIDEAARRAISRKIENKKLNKVAEPLADWNEVKELLEEDTEVILTEIIEHMEFNKAKSLLIDVLKHPQVRRVICTVPLAEFNKYYLIPEGEFRHSDHKWEPNFSQLIKLLVDVSSKVGITVKYTTENIGDCITEDTNVVCPSIGFVVEKI